LHNTASGKRTENIAVRRSIEIRTRQCPVCGSQDVAWPLQLQPTHRPSGNVASGTRE